MKQMGRWLKRKEPSRRFRTVVETKRTVPVFPGVSFEKRFDILETPLQKRCNRWYNGAVGGNRKLVTGLQGKGWTRSSRKGNHTLSGSAVFCV